MSRSLAFVRFSQAVIRHIASGVGFLPQEKIMERVMICEQCPFFEPERNRCGKCGCGTGTNPGFLNKLAYPTERCPDNPPRWDVVQTR